MTAGRPSSTGANALANVLAQLVAPALSLLLVPIYLHYLGLAAYGLVSLLTALIASLAIFSKGLSWVLQRELARTPAMAEAGPARARRLVASFELVYLTLGVVFGVVLACLSAVLARHFAQGHIDAGAVQLCLLCLATRLAVAFPGSAYQAVFMGLSRQVLGNGINTVFALAGSAAMVASAVVTRSVVSLFVADLAVATVGTLVLRHRAGGVLGARTDVAEPRHLDRAQVRDLARLSGGVMVSQAAGTAVKQADRLVVAAVTTLPVLGVYATASAAGRLMALAYAPYLAAVFPGMCSAVARDRSSLGPLVVRNARVVGLLTIGAGVPLALMSRDVLAVWTGHETIAAQGWRAMSLVVLGAVFLGLGDALNQAQLALGTSRVAAVYNSAAVVWLPIALVVLVRGFGITGAGVAWLLYCVAWFLSFAVTTFRGLLQGGLAPYLLGIGRLALAISVLDGAVALAARAVVPGSALGRLLLTATGCALVVAGGFARSPEGRQLLDQTSLGRRERILR